MNGWRAGRSAVLAVACLGLAPAVAPAAETGQSPACTADCPMLEKAVVIDASLDVVWRAWTTNDGLSVVSQRSNVELRVGGPYELFLDQPPDERGRRGSEGSRVLAFVPQQMLAFSWTFPPDVAALRAADETTTVVVVMEEVAADRVQVQLHALGWRPGEDWRAGWAYFDAAWQYVLVTMKRKLEERSAPNARPVGGGPT